MSDKLKRLLDERATVYEAAKDLNARAEKEGRALEGDALQTWDGHMERMSELDKAIDAEDKLERSNARADEIRARMEESTRTPKEKSDQPTDADIVRSIANGEKRAFEFRDLTKGSATAGGNTVPTSFYGTLMEHLIENSAIRQSNVQVLTTAKGEDLQVPKTTTHPTAAIIAEGGSITESDPAFGQVTLGAFKYGFSVQISSELEQDTGVDLLGYLARIGGQALANGSGAHFVVGTGSGQPNGVVTASTAGVTGGTGVTGAFTANNLIDLYYSVIGPYRVNGSWLMGDAAIKAARKLQDGTSGDYLWNNSVLADEPNTLLGRPVLNDTNVVDPALSAKSVVFGDLSRYMIRDVQGVRVERSVDFAFSTDLVTWRFLMRTDGDLIDTTGAVKHFVGGAS